MVEQSLTGANTVFLNNKETKKLKRQGRYSGPPLDSVCFMVNQHPSQLPIFACKPRGQKAKLESAKAKCPYSRDYLSKLYVDNGLTRKQLCETLGVTMGVLNRWMTALGVSRPQESSDSNLSAGRLSRTDPNGPAVRGIYQRMSRENRGEMYGYALIFNPSHPQCNHGGYVLEHRQVIERQLHRFLSKDEDVHHVNYERGDNRLENLMLMKSADHMKFHSFIESCGAWVFGFKPQPAPIKLQAPAFWNGEWFDEISVDTLNRIAASTQKVN